MPRTALKFLHLADLHLDRVLTGGRLRLPHEKALRRARELREALDRALELARTESVDIILIAGDLWEEDNLAADTVPFVIDRLGAVSLPVVLAPGNHDYFSHGSHYSDEIAFARFGKRWPQNVHIFRNYDFTHFAIPELSGVSVTGLAYRSNQPVSLRRLSERFEPPDADLRLAVIHGSRDDHLPPGKMRTLPFSDDELLAQPFDYTALGHYHTRSLIRDKGGKIRAAYPGSTCALGVDESGARGALVGTVERGGVAEPALVFHTIDKRFIHRLTLDISGLDHAQAVESRIRDRLGEADVKPDDMVLVELSGIFPRGSRIALDEDFLRDACFHLRVDASAVRPEWELEDQRDVEPHTTEALYRRRMMKLIQQAALSGDDPENRRLQNALYYGLDALHNIPINPRHAL